MADSSYVLTLEMLNHTTRERIGRFFDALLSTAQQPPGSAEIDLQRLPSRCQSEFKVLNLFSNVSRLGPAGTLTRDGLTKMFMNIGESYVSGTNVSATPHPKINQIRNAWFRRILMLTNQENYKDKWSEAQLLKLKEDESVCSDFQQSFVSRDECMASSPREDLMMFRTPSVGKEQVQGERSGDLAAAHPLWQLLDIDSKELVTSLQDKRGPMMYVHEGKFIDAVNIQLRRDGNVRDIANMYIQNKLSRAVVELTSSSAGADGVSRLTYALGTMVVYRDFFGDEHSAQVTRVHNHGHSYDVRAALRSGRPGERQILGIDKELGADCALVRHVTALDLRCEVFGENLPPLKPRVRLCSNLSCQSCVSKMQYWEETMASRRRHLLEDQERIKGFLECYARKPPPEFWLDEEARREEGRPWEHLCPEAESAFLPHLSATLQPQVWPTPRTNHFLLEYIESESESYKVFELEVRDVGASFKSLWERCGVPLCTLSAHARAAREANRCFFLHLGLATGLNPMLLQAFFRREARLDRELRRPAYEEAQRKYEEAACSKDTAASVSTPEVLNRLAEDIGRFEWMPDDVWNSLQQESSFLEFAVLKYVPWPRELADVRLCSVPAARAHSGGLTLSPLTVFEPAGSPCRRAEGWNGR